MSISKVVEVITRNDDDVHQIVNSRLIRKVEVKKELGKIGKVRSLVFPNGSENMFQKFTFGGKTKTIWRKISEVFLEKNPFGNIAWFHKYESFWYKTVLGLFSWNSQTWYEWFQTGWKFNISLWKLLENWKAEVSWNGKNLGTTWSSGILTYLLNFQITGSYLRFSIPDDQIPKGYSERE